MRFLIYNEIVKKIVFILVVASLLLLSEAITLMATEADGLAGSGKARTVKTSRSALQSAIKVADVGFYYKLDEKARYIDLKNQWQSKHRGEVSFAKACEFSRQAYAQASVEELLSQWRYHGGPNPWIFTGKSHLFNDGKQAYLNVPVQVSFRAKIGDLRVNPAIQMTDFSQLKNSAHWEKLPESHATRIVAIAPGEDILLELGAFNLLDFLAAHPNQWPTEIEVQISSPRFTGSRKVIPLTPDHFVMPTLY